MRDSNNEQGDGENVEESESQYVEEQQIHINEEDSSDELVIVHFQWTQVTLNQQENRNTKIYEDTDILIDTGSTFSIFKIPKMLLNVQQSHC